MKKIVLIVIGMLCILMTRGETIQIKGVVIDSKTKKTIMYANVAIVQLEKGTTSHENGSFSLELEKNEISNLLNVSCINYMDTLIDLKHLNLDEIITIELVPRNYSLREVLVVPLKLKKNIVINKLKKSRVKGGIACDNIPKIYARYFAFKENFSSINTISKVRLYFQPWCAINNSIVKIRILGVDTLNNEPSIDLLRSELVVEVNSNEITEVNLLDYNIKIPQSGVFVAVEWLIVPENIFEFRDEISYGPILGASLSEYSNTWVSFAGKWKKYNYEVPGLRSDNKKKKVFDAGISLILTD